MRPLAAAALVALATLPTAARAETGFEGMVGTWYTETVEQGARGGQKYDLRRQVIHNRADGTKANTFRYYADGRVVLEDTLTYRWGVDGTTYWTVCQTIIRNAHAYRCGDRQEYDVVSITPREVRYKSRANGIVYSLIRVRDDFQLP